MSNLNPFKVVAKNKESGRERTLAVIVPDNSTSEANWKVESPNSNQVTRFPNKESVKKYYEKVTQGEEISLD